MTGQIRRHSQGLDMTEVQTAFLLMELIYSIFWKSKIPTKMTPTQTQPKLYATHKLIIYNYIHTFVGRNTFITAAQFEMT